MNFMKNFLQEINNSAVNSAEELIKFSEENYKKEVFAAAKTVADNDDIKIVSLAGPSASGKTTTAHILKEMLEDMGENTAVVSLDDFYLSGDKQPVLPNGTRDTESVNSLDLKLIGNCLNEVIATGRTQLPIFNFVKGRREDFTRSIDVSDRGIIILEGLHALNPAIIESVDRKNIYKIYISVNDAVFAENGKKLLSSQQIRLVRRILRDIVFRNSDVNRTLEIWRNVVDGEKKYLYCFKETADLLLKTLHPYEVCVYRDDILSVVKDAGQDNFYYDYFLKTALAFEKISSIDKSLVPQTSLIREFIGGGIY